MQVSVTIGANAADRLGPFEMREQVRAVALEMMGTGTQFHAR